MTNIFYLNKQHSMEHKGHIAILLIITEFKKLKTR